MFTHSDAAELLIVFRQELRRGFLECYGEKMKIWKLESKEREQMLRSDDTPLPRVIEKPLDGHILRDVAKEPDGAAIT